MAPTDDYLVFGVDYGGQFAGVPIGREGMTMRWILLLGTALACVGCHYTYHRGFVFDYRGETAERMESGGLDGVEVVQVDNRFGDVRVEPGLEGDYRWAWTLRVWSNTEAEAHQWLERVHLETTEVGGVATWQLVLPEETRGLRGLKSDLTLQVPAAVEVRIENRGLVDVSRTDGPVEIRNEHGDVRLAELTGNVEVDIEHGDVTALQIASTKLKTEHGETRVEQVAGDLDIDSEHVKVRVDQVAGRVQVRGRHDDLEIQNVDGAVDVEHRHGRVRILGVHDEVRVKKEHGNIDVDTDGKSVYCDTEHGKLKVVMRNADLTFFKLKSEHGDVDVVVPSSVTEVAVKTEHGRVNCEPAIVSQGPFVITAEHSDVRVKTVDQ